MKNLPLIGLLSLAGVCGLVTMGQLAPAPSKSSSQVTPTRTVAIFTDLERQLSSALNSGDLTTVNRLLAPDFEVRRSSSPGVPVPRADFIREPHPTEPQLSQMAVHLFGAAAVVSFDSSERGSGTFNVDAWTQEGSDWKLAVRYESSQAANAEQAPTGDKRPTGKE